MPVNATELAIVSGVAKAPGDTNSAEQGLSVLSLLMGENDEGLAAVSWQPQIATKKGDGLWADSAVSPGRQLISAQDGNVTETIQLVCTASTQTLLAMRLSTLYDFKELAENFWETDWQIEPVFLKWHAIDAPGPQYALIYTMTIDVAYLDEANSPTADVALVIEREPYWRGIAPGANPKQWSTHKTGETLTDFDLYGFGTYAQETQHLLKDDNVDNRREWNTTQTAVVSRNYLDIAASLLDGDAPALVNLIIYPQVVLGDSMMIARSSKPTSLPGQLSSNRQQIYVYNAGDGFVGIDTTIAADTGAPQSNSVAAGRRAQCTFVIATMQNRLQWSGGSFVNTSLSTPDITLDRGLYAVFLRCRLSAASTVMLQLRYGNFSAQITNAEVSLTDVGSGGTGNTTQWALVYLGTMKIPVSSERASVGIDGKGLNVIGERQESANVNILIDAERTGGATNLYMSDLILMPLDESFSILSSANNIDMTALALVYDNTGYFMHGKTGDYAGLWQLNVGVVIEHDAVERQGGELTLQPGKDHRLHFHAYDRATMRSDVLESDFQVYLNIVPRWRGVRDA